MQTLGERIEKWFQFSFLSGLHRSPEYIKAVEELAAERRKSDQEYKNLEREKGQFAWLDIRKANSEKR